MSSSKTISRELTALLQLVDKLLPVHGLRKTKAIVNCAAIDPTGESDVAATRDAAAAFRLQCRELGIGHDLVQAVSGMLMRCRRLNSLAGALSAIESNLISELNVNSFEYLESKSLSTRRFLGARL